MLTMGNDGMVSNEYVVAFDVGTSGVKAVVTDVKGKILSVATKNYPVHIPAPKWAEQKPEDYWDNICRVSKEAVASANIDPALIIGIAFCTMWKGIIPVSKNGEILGNNILWLDSRADEEATVLNQRFGADTFSANDYWPKLFWLRKNAPEVYEEADFILDVNSFLKWKATGNYALDLTNSFVRSHDPVLQNFYQAFLDFCHLDATKFPQICSSTDCVGYVSASAAEALGVVPGIPVFGGCGDIPGIAIGTGCASLNGVHAYLGSSGWIGFYAPHQAGHFRYSPCVKGWDIACVGLQAIGLGLNWTISTLYQVEEKNLGGKVYDLLNQEVDAIPAGCEGVLAAPWFYGETPPVFSSTLRGGFFNLGSHHTRGHMARAIMEGIAYSLKIKMDWYLSDAGVQKPCVLRVAGGGAASDVWMQILSDVLDVTIQIPYNARHAGALGAAFCALVGLGRYENFSCIPCNERAEKEFHPNRKTQKEYQQRYQTFCRLYELLNAFYQHLGEKAD